MSKYIKKYSSKINENVIEIDGVYRIGGIKVKKSVITAYKRKVKETTGKDLGSMYSDSQVAEELMYYVVDKYLVAENIPVSALIGGEEGLEEIKDEDDNLNVENEVESEVAPDANDDFSENPAPVSDKPESSDDSFESVSDDKDANPDKLPI